MNIIVRNNKDLYYICSWVDKNDKSKDSKGKNFPVPLEGKKWLYYEEFSKKLKFIENLLKKEERFLKFENKKKCLLCDESYSTGTYKLTKYIWEDNLTHYIEKHFIKPPEEFIDFIFFSKYNATLKLESNII